MEPRTIVELDEPSEEYRQQREELLRQNREQWDERTAVEKLFDVLTRARITHYRPDKEPSLRQDIPCLCCGHPYRPDDPMDAVNIYLCLTCKLESEKGI